MKAESFNINKHLNLDIKMKIIISLTLAKLWFMAAPSLAQQQQVKIPEGIAKLLGQYACLACHKADARLIGPAYVDVAKRKYTNAQIVELIYKPKPANWPGYPPMSDEKCS
jgi:cytochrome c